MFSKKSVSNSTITPTQAPTPAPTLPPAPTIVEPVVQAPVITGGTMTNPAIDGATIKNTKYNQVVLAGSGTVDIDATAGSVFSSTATGNITFTFSNFDAESFQSIAVYVKNLGGKSITFPTGTKFVGGTAPTFTTNGTDVLVVTKDSSGVFSVYVTQRDIK
jgi:hypothetical protein